jgi:hypothetical protein
MHLAVQEVIFKNILVIATHTYARTRTLIQKQTAQCDKITAFA